MAQFKVHNSTDCALTVRFEPSGMEHDIPSTDHVVVGWPDDESPILGFIEVGDGELVIEGPVGLRAWHSSGQELDT
ncbi:hypothetical protein [Catellatospora tritici]|uniref:hypothetical protein n=1 Tax=Catellatospora tritici TaxID=2851566 RepID=UPI001C2D3A9B|nr:hypothetical protein [Catellatospora tritici]MBV1850195.1 hypothetical protein [Catellatospora tritici]